MEGKSVEKIVNYFGFKRHIKLKTRVTGLPVRVAPTQGHDLD